MGKFNSNLSTLRDRSSVDEVLGDSLKRRISKLSKAIAKNIEKEEDQERINYLNSSLILLNQAIQHTEYGDNKSANRLISSARKIFRK